MRLYEIYKTSIFVFSKLIICCQAKKREVAFLQYNDNYLKELSD